MSRDPLKTVLRLCRMEVDASRAELVEREARAHEASQVLHEAEAAIQFEMATASRLSGDDSVVEAFIAWLPTGRSDVTRAKALLSRAQEESAQARARLNLGRAAVEAVEKLLEKRTEEEAKEALRRQQLVLDEAGQRPRANVLS
jgi:flagellar biosynthesis chaperone FliJ